MSKVLDLTTFIEETLDIKMPDGSTIHIKKPTQRMVIAMLNLREKAQSASPTEQIEAIEDAILSILNSNTDGITFTSDSIEDLNVGMRTAIIRAYSEYISGVQSNPNS